MIDLLDFLSHPQLLLSSFLVLPLKKGKRKSFKTFHQSSRSIIRSNRFDPPPLFTDHCYCQSEVGTQPLEFLASFSLA